MIAQGAVCPHILSRLCQMLFGEDLSAACQALRVPWCSVPSLSCLCLEWFWHGVRIQGSACSAMGLA